MARRNKWRDTGGGGGRSRRRMKKPGNQGGRGMLREERVWGGYFVDLIAKQLRQSFLFLCVSECVNVCAESPISPTQTLAAVFHLSLSAPEPRGVGLAEEETGGALDVRGPGWSFTSWPGWCRETQVDSPGRLISSAERDRNGKQSSGGAVSRGP